MNTWKERFGKIILILPIYTWLILFILIPFLMTLKISLSTDYGQNIVQKLEQGTLQITLYFQSYCQLFTDPFYKSVMWSSFSIAGITTIITALMGVSMAYAIFKTNERWRLILLLAVVLPLCTSFLMRVYAWMELLSSNGLVNKLLLWFKIVNTPIPFIGNWYAVVIGTVYCYLPFMVLPIYAQLSKVDKTLLEASSDLGARPYQTFWHITLPLIFPGIITGCILVFIPVMGEFIIPELLGSAEIVTLGRAIQWEFFTQHNWIMTSSIAIITLMLFVIPTIVFQVLNSVKEVRENQD